MPNVIGAVALSVAVAVIALTAGLPAASAGSIDTSTTCRDRFQWPFSEASIWNTPIGGEAEYHPANLFANGQVPKNFHSDQEYFYRIQSNVRTTTKEGRGCALSQPFSLETRALSNSLVIPLLHHLARQISRSLSLHPTLSLHLARSPSIRLSRHVSLFTSLHSRFLHLSSLHLFSTAPYTTLCYLSLTCPPLPLPQDPLTPWFNQGWWGSPGGNDHCIVESPQPYAHIPFPANATATNFGGNNAAGMLQPDNVTLLQMQPLYRCQPNSPVLARVMYPRTWVDQSILGNGTHGAHGGSGLSAMGGSLRLGELLAAPGTHSIAPIRHALKLELWAHQYYYGHAPGYHWPATQHDNYAFNQSSPLVYNGVLVLTQ